MSERLDLVKNAKVRSAAIVILYDRNGNILMLKRVDDSAHGNEGFLSKAEVKSIKTQFKNYPWLESKCPNIFKLL